MNKQASVLTGLEAERVSLCDVNVSAVLQDLLAEVTISQTYRNDERVNIEAVYTFPLPLDAVLLDFEADIGGRVLKGVVVEKKAAEENYENTVEAGDTAVMLEAIEPGLYTLNVGNLLPQETARITFRYAVLYRWTGDRLRFYLPTTIAPRYGEPLHLPHQAPEASLTVENKFSLSVEVLGALREAQFVCPSHPVKLTKSPEKTVLSLQQAEAVMDRDFVLNVKAPQATRSFILCGQDGEGMAAIASFQPFFPGLQHPRPLALVIVIDCSGSMQGDSMDQAKHALEGILERLQPQDRVTLIAFGSSINVFSDHLLPCTTTTLSNARRFANALDATLGGTEIGNALRIAYSAAGGKEAADLFLVTDGEVSDWEPVVEKAAESGHRIFTVGVGSAVSEAFVRGLASKTGGECELVIPGEDMAERIVRHFERIRAPGAKRVAVHWPDGAAKRFPSRMGAVFEGDAVLACATFARLQAGASAILEIETDAGEILREELAIRAVLPSSGPDELSTVARLAAATRLTEADEVTGLQTALRYRLISPWTNWLLEAPQSREETVPGIPALRKIPQTLAAGWSGIGRVDISLGTSALHRLSVGESCRLADADTDDLELTVFEPAVEALPDQLRDPHQRLLELVNADASRLHVGAALELLTESGLAAEFGELLRAAADLGLSVDIIAAIVIARLLGVHPNQFLSGTARLALASLQERAREATEALWEIGRHGLALARLTRETVARDALRTPSGNELLEKFAQIRGFCDQMDAALRPPRERVQQEQTTVPSARILA